MGLIERVLGYLKERRQNLIDGKVNCIPSPFTSFRQDFVGTELRQYILISGNQKSGKTQLTSFLFIYNNILYAYYHKEQVRIKIFYVPLEETPELVTMRFMCYLLFKLSKHRIRIGIKDLQSTIEGHPVSEEVLYLLESKEYKDILSFFESCIIWVGATNPTGIFKEIVQYADEHGKRVFKEIEIQNKATLETEKVKKFDHYEPDDPNEYVEIIIDHISIINTEGNMDLRQSIAKYSSYMVELRNKYNYIPIVIQQQTAEAQGLDAFKLNRIRPSVSGLGDGKTTARDCDIMLGIFNPFAFEKKDYLNYDISKLRDHQRFLEVVLNRHGQSNGIKALYFDGAVSFFSELKHPKDPEYESFIEKVYTLIERLKQETGQAVSMLSFRKKRKTNSDIQG